MTILSLRQTRVGFLATCGIAVFLFACGGNVVVDASHSTGSGGAGGTKGSGGTSTTTVTGSGGSVMCLANCGGPANPASCAEGDECPYCGGTICGVVWTCTSGKWSSMTVCAQGDSSGSGG